MGNCQKVNSKEDPIRNSSIKDAKSNSLQLIGKTFTWNRDSHGLFDYENKNIFKNVFKISYSCYLMREHNEVRLIKSKEEDSPKEKRCSEMSLLARISVKDSNFYVSSILLDSSPGVKSPELDGLHANSLWIVVKSLKVNAENRIFKLSQGDYIKLGRIRFRIKEFSNKHDPTLMNQNSMPTKPAIIKEESNKGRSAKPEIKTRVSQLLCRICLSDCDDEDNPFITPCKCAGSMQFIHIRCLQQWLQSKLQIKQTFCSMSFVWKSFECELCKSTYPDWIEAHGTKYDIVEIPRPESPYMILEILSRDKNQCRGMHVLNMGLKSAIKLGRGHDSELRITDISVSRCHAILKYEKGSFFIEDNASKFGTLVLAKDALPVSIASNHLALQVGRTVLYFSVKKIKKIMNAYVKFPAFWLSLPLKLPQRNSTIARTETSDGEKKEEASGLSPLHAGTHIYEVNEENNPHSGAEELFLEQEEQAPEDEIVGFY